MFWIIPCIISILLLIVIADWLIIGFAKPVRGMEKCAKEYLLKMPNRMAYQKSTECSGFSTAYVLRSFGIEADGNDVYAKIKRKMKNGAVMPRALKKEMQGYTFGSKDYTTEGQSCTFKAEYVKGSLKSLKKDLSNGKRIIVFIKTRLDKKWLHYVPIVGYDEENVFIAESLTYLTNCVEEYYNRKLSKQDFLKYWDTREWYMPFYKNTYLRIDKK